ncbi:uncharacterized protein LOC123541086 isoform X2 [Mercenaria mercenaria]|uniref:uncharacterized protein LOC123541086 isoform X2 n=1 Tax=Mercenaria mercenaria TaxID=6596 RepID=UPI00234F5B2E|nr:uncharacterized protein LOC123541086 isoform X2 [Mercenaria mercenaria]
MEAYNRLQEDKKPRVLFIITCLPVLIISVLSMWLYLPRKHEKAEFAQLANQGTLLFILGIIHFLGGLFSLKWNIDYSRYKPLAACICWNAWLLVILVLHTNSIILYTEVLWQISVHWNLYNNGQQRRD